jgi:hypothetical protein
MENRAMLARKEYLQPGELKGIFVPTVTPFKTVNGHIQLDVISHQKQIMRLAHTRSRISGIFLASNAGQGRDMDINNPRAYARGFTEDQARLVQNPLDLDFQCIV